MKNVVLCVSGGIAAYKAVDLVSKLKKNNINVDVLMTKSATEFITPLTFESISGNRVVYDMFNRDFTFDVEHISLAKKADVFVVVPATANVIGKIANGIADDMITTTAMATKAPILFAPAMNTNMFENKTVQKNIEILKSSGNHFVSPAVGRLACGDVGTGKLADIDDILEGILNLLQKKDLLGKNILITAGATREKLDPVRYISNNSTGKMGYALAKAATFRGANVTLISGKSYLKPPKVANFIDVLAAKDMLNAVLDNFDKQDIVIKAAAVSDYTPINVAQQKIKKKDDNFDIKLEKTVDILKKIGKNKRENQILCGFSMETENLIENSYKKLVAKNLDMIVANNLKTAGAGFEVDTNIVTLITKNNPPQELGILDKFDVANKILDEILKMG